MSNIPEIGQYVIFHSWKTKFQGPSLGKIIYVANESISIERVNNQKDLNIYVRRFDDCRILDTKDEFLARLEF